MDISASEIETIILDALDDHLYSYTESCCGYSQVDGKCDAASAAAKKIMERLSE